LAGMSDKPLTYADAGVSIAAGNALVKAIGPLARSTARPGADAALGGFGGLFDLKAAGYRASRSVASPARAPPSARAAAGAEPLSSPDYFATGRLDPAVAERVVASIAEGCRQAGCAL